MAKWEMVGASTGELTVSMEGDEWKEALEKAKERLEMRSRQVGVNERIEKPDIAKVAVNENIKMLFERGIEEFGLEPASEPETSLKKISIDGVEVCFRFAVMPEIVIPDLSVLCYQVEPVNVSNEDIEAEIAALKDSIASQGQKIPSDNDEFASMLGIDGVSCYEDLKGSINDALAKNRTEMAERDAENDLLDAMAMLFEFEAPDGMVDMEVDSMVASDKDQVASMNGDWEEFLKSARKSEEDLKYEYREEAKRNIKVRLALAKIAQEYGLKPSQEEIEAEYQSMAIAYGVPVEDFKNVISENDIIYQKSLVMAMDYIKK